MDDVTLTPAITRQRVLDCIGELLPRVLDREITAIAPDTRLMAELGMRSSSTLELLLELELALDIHIDVEDIDEGAVSSVGDLAGFVASHSAPVDPDLVDPDLCPTADIRRLDSHLGWVASSPGTS